MEGRRVARVGAEERDEGEIPVTEAQGEGKGEVSSRGGEWTGHERSKLTLGLKVHDLLSGSDKRVDDGVAVKVDDHHAGELGQGVERAVSFKRRRSGTEVRARGWLTAISRPSKPRLTISQSTQKILDVSTGGETMAERIGRAARVGGSEGRCRSTRRREGARSGELELTSAASSRKLLTRCYFRLSATTRSQAESCS